jgi:hypothetical protein
MVVLSLTSKSLRGILLESKWLIPEIKLYRSVHNNALTDAAVLSLIGIGRDYIKTIVICYARIIGASAFASLLTLATKLKSLDLKYCSIGELLIDFLPPSLEVLNVASCGWSADGIRRMEDEKPDVELDIFVCTQ